MKHIPMHALLAGVLACTPLMAAELHVEISVPDVEYLLPPVSPPQLEKEGLPLLQERQIVEPLLEFIGADQYEAGLAHVRERRGDIMALLEAGDPDGEVASRAVVGGMMPSTGGGQISATLLYLLGHTYFTLDNHAAAETAFLAALRPVPDYIRVHESLGLLYLDMERYEEAREALAHAAELGLHTPGLFGALGYINHQTGNHWGAANAFQEAMMLNPGNENWERGLLFSLGESYQYASGLSLVESILQDRPDEPVYWVYRSQFALQADQREKALTSLETAIRLGNDTVANLQVCATLHMELGSVGRAVELLRAGYLRGMDFSFVDQAMSWLVQAGELAFLGELIGTVREGWDALDAMQQSRVLLREADISLADGSTEDARAALREAVDLDATNADALMALAAIEKDLGNYDRAELLYQRASSFDRHRENALVSMAQLAIDQDDYPRALELLRQVVTQYPNRTDLRRSIDSLENLVQLRGGN